MHDLETAPSRANHSRKPRLLVGENNAALRDLLLALFKAEGYEVLAVASGTDLMDAVAVSLHPEFGSGEFDLVISESHILGPTELQTFSRLGGWAKVPPFVFVTNFADKELQVKKNQFDVVAMLEKPLDIDNLRELVKSYLHHPTEKHGNAQSDTAG